MKESGCLGFNQLLVTPEAADALQEQINNNGSNGGGSASNFHRAASRSVISLLVLCLSPGATLTISSALDGLDEDEAAALLAKSAGVSYYNPEILALAQSGSHMQTAHPLLHPSSPFLR
ncbi:hypothetical protein cyc_07497 [Cyclospora cayetanensis]|uniref:Uncharacterized protein n=1 Tax=Cyclospora cayetanensis TaxID=88456 RepID=A0A1D3D821_9EIME|nr:hypothetical protein cyc_07497 [Cyclospora cayetanensis]